MLTVVGWASDVIVMKLKALSELAMASPRFERKRSPTAPRAGSGNAPRRWPASSEGRGPDVTWNDYPNLRNRPLAPAKNRGRVQVRIRRAFIASGAEVLSASAIYDWTHPRRRRQYWHRGGGAGTRGWLYAPPGPCVERNQRDALSGVAPAVTDLLGGQVQTMFNSLPASIEYIKADTLRALAVTTAKRSETLPGIPTMGEFVPGYEASQWYGVGAPKARPPRSSTGSTRRLTQVSPTLS
jgi:Tripartite tricarboxylate transporter family receptor